MAWPQFEQVAEQARRPFRRRPRALGGDDPVEGLVHHLPPPVEGKEA
jgi:hypothetical protein